MVAHAEMVRATSALTDLKGMSLILVCFANALCIGVLTVVFFNSWHALVLFVHWLLHWDWLWLTLNGGCPIGRMGGWFVLYFL